MQLSDRFGGDSENTVVALDLGGGSTQVTFALDEDGATAIRAHDPESIQEITAFHQKLDVYTHRYFYYLKLGSLGSNLKPKISATWVLV